MSAQIPLLYDTAPHQPHSVTSGEAAARIAPARASLRARVLELLRATPGGLTDEEIQRALAMNPSTERPRRIELVERGEVVDSKATRPTLSGRPATVWAAAWWAR